MKKVVLLFLSALVFVIGSAFQTADAQVKINEFLAHNVWTNADMVDYDDFSDWIELRNEGSSAVDVGGYYLTGNLKNPKKSAIPASTSIPANGYLFIWADGNTGKKKALHAGFKLDKDGEQLGLFDKSGAVVDSITFGPQIMDVSMGRNPTDGSWCYFDQPTPGAANSTPAKKTNERSGTVSFSVEAGFISAAQSVTLTSSDNSPIYYTTNGSVPNASSTKYSSPISVSATTVIRARTITSDKIAGVVATNTYLKETARKIMVIEMTTEQKFLDDPTIGIFKNYMKYRKVPVVFECFGADGKPAVRFNGGIEVGSLTNQTCPQKPLQVALSGRYGDEFVNYKFFGKKITKFNRLRLRQGGDAWNTNFIADDLLDPISDGQMTHGIQAYRPVATFINGKYNGLMDLREQFKNEYFKQNYGVDTTGMQEIRRTLINNSEGWEVVHGSKSNWTSIESGASNYETTKTKVDINSMIDYYAIESFACNVSWGHNEDMWMAPGGKWRWLTTDIDRCFDYNGQYSTVSSDILHTKGGGLSGALMTQSTIFSKLMANTEFKNHFGQRYAAHLNSTLKPERLTRIIDSVVTMISSEMTNQASKWGSQGGIKSMSAWMTEISTVKNFCNERGAIELKNLAKDLTGGTAKLTVTVTNPGSGDIYIEGVRMSEGLSNLTFFKSAPLAITAKPKNGCAFTGWGGGATGTGDSTNLTLSGDKTITAGFSGTPLEVIPTVSRETEALYCKDRAFALGGAAAITVDFSFAASDHVAISLFNVSGQKVVTLFDANMNPGAQKVSVTSKRLPAGIYLYVIKTNVYTRTNVVNVR